MVSRVRIYPYNPYSRSAYRLAAGLDAMVLKTEGSKFVQRESDVIINWGSSKCPYANPLNSVEAVVKASNKLLSFKAFKAAGVPSPDFWTNADEIPDEAFPVVCRTILCGHSGAGIHIANTREELVLAPLYVGYVKKQDEFRVHVMGTSIILVQRKARRLETPNEEVNWQVRNHDNGFVFVRNEVDPGQLVLDAATAAIAALGLDFGAVDIIWNEKQQKALVLEVNTACGMEGSTVTDYAEGFKKEFLK